MFQRLGVAAALAFGLGFLAPAARAEIPKAGDYFTDSSDLGFKVKVPKDWELIPPSPDDGNLIAKFDPDSSKTILVGDKSLPLHCWVVKFDRRKDKASDGAVPAGGKRKFVQVEKNLTEWINHNVEGSPGFKVETQKDLEVNKIPATRHVYVSKNDPQSVVRAYAMLYKLSADVDVALVFNGPGDPKKWDKWDNAFEEMAKTFKVAEVKASKAAPLAAGSSMRDRKRAKIQDDLRLAPGWKLYEAEHYFIVSNKDDKLLIDELMDRLEAIHEIYEQDYPAAKVAELRAAGAAAKTGDNPGTKPKGTTDAPEPPKEPIVDPQELAKCSVVRFCATEEQYHSYGGPDQTAGYFSSNSEELVLYVDKVGGISDTWATMNHEAFHQYIYYFYGSIAPHSWYNEGTGDFYAGLEYKNKRFTLHKFDWRVGMITTAIGEDDKALRKGDERKIVPLKDLVRMTQPEYYGQNKHGIDGHHNYAQGWSFIYFLRTGKKANAKGWDPRWDTILETYLRVLASSGKVEQAVEEAFMGVDFDALEAAWKDYTK